MTAKTVYHSTRTPSKKMSDHSIPLAVLGFLATLFVGFFRPICRKLFPPKLKLIDQFFSDSQHWAGMLRISVQNTGKTKAKDVRIDLHIKKPQGIRQGNGLFFNLNFGDIETESIDSPGLIHFRLKPHLFVRPKEPPQEIASRFIFAVEYTPPEELDHEIDWTIRYNGMSNSGTILRSGAYLKSMILQNLYESGHVIGYDIPTGKIPESREEDSGQ